MVIIAISPHPLTKILWTATTIILIILAGVAVWTLKPSVPASVMRFDYHLPEGQQLNERALIHLAVSDDGSHFVYATNSGLYVRSLDQLEARAIPGTDENPHAPFFSPDGQWVGYYSIDEQQLKKIIQTLKYSHL